MPKYNCERCGKEFKQKCDYNDHINRKKPCKNVPPKTADIPPKTAKKKEFPIKSISIDKVKCNYCGGEFTRLDSLTRHLNGRCKIKKANDARMEEIMNMLIEIKENNKELKEKVDKLENENSNYKKIINNTQNNTQNINISLPTNIVAYGTEDLTKISDLEYKRILRRGFNSVPALLESLHFDKNKPENHNVYISNMRDDYVLMYDGNKWRLKNRKDALEQLYEDKTDILETKFEELLERLDENTIRMFQRFIKVKDDDDSVIKRIKNELKTILYDNRDMIKNARTICHDSSQTELLDT